MQEQPPIDPAEPPAPGYPITEEAITNWFQGTHGRMPTDREVGAIIDAMAKRDATPPHEGPDPEPHGRLLGPSAAPADRR